MLCYAFGNMDRGAYIQVSTDSPVFNLRRFAARSKTTDMRIRDLILWKIALPVRTV